MQLPERKRHHKRKSRINVVVSTWHRSPLVTVDRSQLTSEDIA